MNKKIFIFLGNSILLTTITLGAMKKITIEEKKHLSEEKKHLSFIIEKLHQADMVTKETRIKLIEKAHLQEIFIIELNKDSEWKENYSLETVAKALEEKNSKSVVNALKKIIDTVYNLNKEKKLLRFPHLLNRSISLPNSPSLKKEASPRENEDHVKSSLHQQNQNDIIFNNNPSNDESSYEDDEDDENYEETDIIPLTFSYESDEE